MEVSEFFNPHTQNINMYYPDGSNITISLADMNESNRQSIRLAVVFASQIGACGMVLFLLAVLTTPDRRRAPIFIINLLSLFVCIVRSVLQISYFTSAWYDTFAFYAYYWNDIPRSAYATSITTTVMALILQICVLSSLVLQVRVICAANPRLNLIMTMISVFVALFSIGWFTAVTVQISITTIKNESYISPYVYPTARAVFAASICFFSATFVIKLGHAIRQRKAMGLERWSPLQVIFIMGLQTLIVPAIFSVLENVKAVNFDGMSSLTPCLVALSLPISSIWATHTVDSNSGSPRFSPHNSNRLLKTVSSDSKPGLSRATTAVAIRKTSNISTTSEKLKEYDNDLVAVDVERRIDNVGH